MSWRVAFLSEAVDDLKRLDNSVRKRVLRALQKTSQNPLPVSEGGYGKPLGNRHALDLVGLFKIKLRLDGVRVVYRLQRVGDEMLVIVIGARSDDDVYREAARRRKAHGI